MTSKTNDLLNQIDDLSDALNGRDIEIDRLQQQVTIGYRGDRLWTAVEVGAYLGYSRRVIMERVALTPGFPVPIRLPAATDGGLGAPPRWGASGILPGAGQFSAPLVQPAPRAFPAHQTPTA